MSFFSRKSFRRSSSRHRSSVQCPLAQTGCRSGCSSCSHAELFQWQWLYIIMWHGGTPQVWQGAAQQLQLFSRRPPVPARTEKRIAEKGVVQLWLCVGLSACIGEGSGGSCLPQTLCQTSSGLHSSPFCSTKVCSHACQVCVCCVCMCAQECVI